MTGHAGAHTAPSTSRGNGWQQIALRIVVFPYGIFWLAKRAGASKFIAILASVIGSLMVIGIIGAASGGGKKTSPTASGSSPSDSPAAVAPAATPTYGGVVRSPFASKESCFACGDMIKYVSASNAWCGWKDGKVVVHVTFRNTSIEHLTIHWHPSYTIVGGGGHGDGLTSIQDAGIDAGATRQVFATQEPKGVPADSTIDECKPSYSTVDSG